MILTGILKKKKNIALFKKGFGGEKFQYTFFGKLF